MCEDATVAWQGQFSIVELGHDGYLWVIHQRLANVLVVDLVFLADF